MNHPSVFSGVHRAGSRWVNLYLIEEGGRFTLLDAGFPGYRGRLERLLSALGRSVTDIDAVVLTHSHVDHVGLASSVQRSAGARVLVHPADAAAVRGDEREGPPRFLDQGWRPFIYRYLLHALSHGATRPPPVADVSELADGEVIDVPGRPRVIHTPGHTAGSCALLLEDRGVLLSGDALVTIDLLTGRPGPALPPDFVNRDTGEARSSLRRLESLKAGVVLPGHGEPWTQGVASAVDLARRSYSGAPAAAGRS